MCCSLLQRWSVAVCLVGLRSLGSWVEAQDSASLKVLAATDGHSNETFEDPVLLEALSRGTLWAAGKLAVAAP